MQKKPKRLKEVIKEFDKLDYNKPNTFGEEGVDHLNISLTSDSKLGRFLDPSYSHYFNFFDLGQFRSPINLVYWLRDPDKDDRLRYIKKKDLNKVTSVKTFPVLKNHMAYLLLSMYVRLKMRPDLIDEIKSLPKDFKILSYRIQPKSSIRITTGYAKMVVPVVEEIIASVRENRVIHVNKFVQRGCTLDFIDSEVYCNLSLNPPKKQKPILTTKERERINRLGKVVGLDKVEVIDGDSKIEITPEGITFS